jgi:hypothetical protein
MKSSNKALIGSLIVLGLVVIAVGAFKFSRFGFEGRDGEGKGIGCPFAKGVEQKAWSKYDGSKLSFQYPQEYALMNNGYKEAVVELYKKRTSGATNIPGPVEMAIFKRGAGVEDYLAKNISHLDERINMDSERALLNSYAGEKGAEGFPTEKLEIVTGYDSTYSVWLFYDKGDKEAQRTLYQIYNSLKLK